MKVIPSDKIRKIIIIRPEMIGDTILLTPLISEIRKKLPSAGISMLVLPHTEEVIKNNPDVTNYIRVKKNMGFNEYLELLDEIKKQKFDLSIVLEDNPTPEYALLTFLAGIPMRIGDKSRILYGWTYNYGVWLNSADPSLHQVELHGQLLAPLGIKQIKEPYNIQIDQESRAVIDLFLKNNNLKGKSLVGLHIGTGGGNKPLLAETYAKIAELLEKRFNSTVILLGGKRELKTIEEIKSLTKKSFLDLVDKLTLPELFALTERLNIFIGVDSGPLHIASALKIPVVAIYPAKDVNPARWLPWMTNFSFIKNESPCPHKCSHRECELDLCQKGIDPDMIIDRTDKLLKGKTNE